MEVVVIENIDFIMATSQKDLKTTLVYFGKVEPVSIENSVRARIMIDCHKRGVINITKIINANSLLKAAVKVKLDRMIK